MDKIERIEIVNSWLKDISAIVGFELRLDDEGLCTVKIGEDILAIEVATDLPLLHLYTPLVSFSTEDQEHNISLMVKALELNAFQILTRGGAIASAPGGGLLIYCLTVPIEGTDSLKFSQILGAFYETLPELKKLLSSKSAISRQAGSPLGCIKA